MYCKFCGKEISENAVICTHCGAQVKELEVKSDKKKKTLL